MPEARAAYVHAHRVKHLGEQADAWYQASSLTEYIAAVRAHATSLPPGQEQTVIEAWLACADAHVQHLTKTVSAPKLAPLLLSLGSVRDLRNPPRGGTAAT